MTDWEYYYLDESDAEPYASGLFQLTRSDISEEKPITETVNLGAINLDFRGNQLVGIEIFQDAEKVIMPEIREGNVEQPKTLELEELSESAKRFINKNKDNREKNFL